MGKKKKICNKGCEEGKKRDLAIECDFIDDALLNAMDFYSLCMKRKRFFIDREAFS